MTTLVKKPTAALPPDETTRLLPPSTFETTKETRGGGKGGTEGANEKNEKKLKLRKNGKKNETRKKVFFY